MGLSNSKILWNGDAKQWEMWDLSLNKIAAQLNTTYHFPLGTQSWYFYPYVNCHDRGQITRDLNLHPEIKRPGKFSCRDGNSIDSELVCDGDHHCNDDSDEYSCQFVNPRPGYLKATPPKTEGSDKVNLSSLKYAKGRVQKKNKLIY